MQVILSPRGFEQLTHEARLEPHLSARLASQSSAIGNYPDSFSRSGSSFLWVGKEHHLDREEVQQLIAHLQNWLDTGHLSKERG